MTKAVLTIMLTAAVLTTAMLTACSESTTPLPASISTVQIETPKSTLMLGDSLEVRATARAADGSAVTSGNVAWTSSDTAVATVAATGRLTAKVRTISAGSVTITATVESHFGQLNLAVTAPPPPPPPQQTSPSLAFIWSRETGMIALTFPAGAERSSAMAINDLGQVVGHVVIDGRVHAFVWTLAAGMVDIGGLTGSVHSYATAINNAGQVAGYSVDANYHNRAFRWSPSEGIIALPMPPGTDGSYARGINASGEVVGERGGSAFQVAFRWSQEKGTEDLASFESTDGAVAIADNGDVVGYSLDWGWYGFTYAVLWTAGGTKKILDTCNPAPNPYCASANAINSAGQIAGNSYYGFSSLAFRLTVGADRQNITGAPGSNISEANAINEAGQVVGSSKGPGFPLWHAYLWSPIGGAIDLGALPGRQGSGASGINNRGQVVGSSY